MRRFLIVVSPVLAWLVWAAVTLPPPARVLAGAALVPGTPPTARGAYHVHSRASDGTGTIEEIAAAAEAAGLQFVLIAAHEAHARLLKAAAKQRIEAAGGKRAIDHVRRLRGARDI